ncbi:hypothetical protein Poly51_24570 [Rubripirellula tenax]|uniref:SGNH hydrolase-type esterase domain-containing protein n=1 Tax=Rubripirellula tenax TaxID=2528015 RepID=A0A5C6F8U4_9BACT|nr:hypothetical protein [Rubripirellula tenax]TWU56546.1 hypothetical protein Poly51_24570 [Rubripirellula tenax]
MWLRWISGVLTGTLIVAVTSPLFVRSYLPRHPSRITSEGAVWTLPAGGEYRWRAEGYATTAIGPHGMPGKVTVPGEVTMPGRDASVRRIALWGDSQAEGVCVDDAEKIFSQTQRGNGGLCVFPLAQSGDSVNEWVRQFEWAETELGVTEHVILLVELSDLILGGESAPDPSRASLWVSANLPAFLIASIRNLATDASGELRSLRFRPGPIPTVSPVGSSQQQIDFDAALRRIQQEAGATVTIVYAPKLPRIQGDQIVTSDDDDHLLDSLKRIAVARKINMIDLRPELIAAGRSGHWPHGFHNGQFGSGHLNATGNAIVAKAIARHFR